LHLARLALLAILAAYPGWGGPVQASAPGALYAQESETATLRRPFAERFANELRASNRQLSDAEVQRIVAAVGRYSRKYELEPELVAGVLLRESNGRPWVRSNRGAVGLMQVMPHVGLPLELAGNLATVETNIEAGCIILADNIRRLGEEDGISAYFWGSDIRGAGYLKRVQEARALVQAGSES